MCVFISSTTFARYISHSKKKWARYDQKCISVFMLTSRHSCPILLKLELSRQIFEKKTQISNFMKTRPMVSHSKKKWARYDQKCISVFMLTSRHSCPILLKLELSRQIFEKKKSNFMKTRPMGAELFHAHRWTAGQDETVAFRNIGNAPKNEAPIPLPHAAIYGNNLHWSITMTTDSCNKCDNRRSRSCCGKMHTDGAQTKHAIHSAEEVCLLKKTTIYVNDKQSKTPLKHFILLYP